MPDLYTVASDDSSEGREGRGIAIDERPRRPSMSSAYREPIRSFLHESVRDGFGTVDGAQHARSVRQDTAELASYVLGRGSPLRWVADDVDDADDDDDDWDAPSVILEASEPPSPPEDAEEGPSLIASMLRRAPIETQEPSSEETPLLSGQTTATFGSDSRTIVQRDTMASEDVEGQKDPEERRSFSGRLCHAVTSKDVWNRHALWEHAVVAPVSCLPAVAVGLLLNILDGLSYGMILFPLGNPIFSHLGPAGMSMFYISTIISQLTFSSGSIFKGAIGSELIEVVPFFHNMAATIADTIRDDGTDAIIATTIVSYALSSMMTGLVFYLMGRFHFGYVVGFIPRHILTGCIGGVGWFLVATGFEVSARLEGNLEYNLATARELLRPEKVPLWAIPLGLAVILFWGQTRGASKHFLPLFILCIPVLFYASAAVLDEDSNHLRDRGWVFDRPPDGEPWWYFYTLYQFHLVRWDAVLETVPAMLALTFFGILHVPINVPALARQCGQDDADLDVELKLHGYSNFMSGLAGSIQNYLVYANTTFFMRSGGDQRLAGYMLAALTAVVMVMGPSLVGLIPVMMVGTLIFDLGFELLLEALWEPRRRMRPAEYATVVAIVLVMGIYDFVVGIGVGILLAFVSLIVQSSRVSPVRGSYGGDVVTSTVRRSPSQHAYLQRAGSQIYMVKLTGYLFFGTIVSVEAKIRALLEGGGRRIRYVVIDMWHVSGLDYSAGEGFGTIHRLLTRRGISLVLSGVADGSQLAQSLRMVYDAESGVVVLPDLNSALESCENELLKTLYASELALKKRGGGGVRASSPHQNITPHRDIVQKSARVNPLAMVDAMTARSPRQSDLHEAAALTLQQHTTPQTAAPASPPLALLLRIIRGVGFNNNYTAAESFWEPAAALFTRIALAPGTTLFKRGERAGGFYLVERGILRAEYELPQGRLWESIVAGTSCGELPFFSGTLRTATVFVEGNSEGYEEEEEEEGGEEEGNGCVLWMLDTDGWMSLQTQRPDVARELLTLALKLTSERMGAITAYTLAVAG